MSKYIPILGKTNVQGTTVYKYTTYMYMYIVVHSTKRNTAYGVLPFVGSCLVFIDSLPKGVHHHKVGQ